MSQSERWAVIIPFRDSLNISTGKQTFSDGTVSNLSKEEAEEILQRFPAGRIVPRKDVPDTKKAMAAAAPFPQD